MALRTTTHAENWHVLMEVANVTVDGASGQTVRWADADVALSDGTLYERRILGMSPLRQELGRLLEAQFVLADVTVRLDNTDGVVRDLLDDNYGMAGKAVTIKVGYGNAASDYETRFSGEVRYPDGARWTDAEAEITCDDAIEADDIIMPANKVWPTDYADAEDKSLFASIPEVLGDFRTTDGNGETVPGFCLDTTVGTGGQFTFGQHLTAVEDVYLNGVSASYTVNQLTGPSKVTLNVAYDPSTDAVSANVRGRQTTIGDNSPIAWAYDVLTASWGMGLSSTTRVDGATFSALLSAYGATDRCRRWVGSDVKSLTLLAELCHDGFFEAVVNSAGKWEAVARLAAAPAGVPTIRQVDILPAGVGRDFKVVGDPERAYANQIIADFNYRPPAWDGRSLSAVTEYVEEASADSTTEQAAIGRVVRRRIKCKWICEDDAAQDRAELELYVYGTRLEMVEVKLGPQGLLLDKSDTFNLIYNKYAKSGTEGTPMMVRAIEPDFMALSAMVLAWNMDRLQPRRYQADGSPDWSGATTYARQIMGFYEQDANQVYY